MQKSNGERELLLLLVQWDLVGYSWSEIVLINWGPGSLETFMGVVS